MAEICASAEGPNTDDKNKPKIPVDLVKKLREVTGLGWMDCKRALAEAGGDIAKAVEFLRKGGLKEAELRSSRSAREGRIGHYVHSNGRIGVLVELNCETDFAAKSPDFEQLLKDLCMQVAAQRPIYVAVENVPADRVSKEREIVAAQLKDKPAQVAEKIAEGKMKEFFKSVCLMEQPFIKEPAHSVRDRVSAVNAKLGENLVVRRFMRFELGEET
jgi:elongation factor Ts